jgi:CubicO group peptidase (beta-lactamase class C family)
MKLQPHIPGNIFYHKEFGRKTLDPSSAPIKTSHFFKLASCTKLITVVAALQCVDRDLITLDEPVKNVLPELAELETISWANVRTKEFKLKKTEKEITLRHLLTHSSGVAYDNISPILKAWRSSRGERSLSMAATVPEAFGCPLLFEPGEGWHYGGGIDWAGYLIRRLNANITLEEFFTENIFKLLGCSAPYPTFDLSKHQDAKEQLVQLVRRKKGGIVPGSIALGEHPVDELGGAGLVCSADHFVAVLADIISDTPSLLKPETADELFKPSFAKGSASHDGMKSMSTIIEAMAGPSSHNGINQSLGGLTVANEVDSIGQPGEIMMWSGYTNTLWIASRKHGIAGFLGAQVVPPDDAVMEEVWKSWREDLWKVWREIAS